MFYWSSAAKEDKARSLHTDSSTREMGGGWETTSLLWDKR